MKEVPLQQENPNEEVMTALGQAAVVFPRIVAQIGVFLSNRSVDPGTIAQVSELSDHQAILYRNEARYT